MNTKFLFLLLALSVGGCGPDQSSQPLHPPGTQPGFPPFPGGTPGFPNQQPTGWPVEEQETCTMIQDLVTWNILDSGVDALEGTMTQAALSNSEITRIAACASMKAQCPAQIVSATQGCEDVLAHLRFVMARRCEYLGEALVQNQSNLSLFAGQARMTRNRAFKDEYSTLAIISYNNLGGLCSLMKRESCGNLPAYCSEYR